MFINTANLWYRAWNQAGVNSWLCYRELQTWSICCWEPSQSLCVRFRQKCHLMTTNYTAAKCCRFCFRTMRVSCEYCHLSNYIAACLLFYCFIRCICGKSCTCSLGCCIISPHGIVMPKLLTFYRCWYFTTVVFMAAEGKAIMFYCCILFFLFFIPSA